MTQPAVFKYHADERRDFTRAIADLHRGLKLWRLWFELALDDLRQRYRRTVFGALWVSVSYLVFAVTIALIGSQMTGTALYPFMVYVAVGYLAWNFINASVTDGCTVFINTENWIAGLRLPFSLFVFQSIARETIIFGYGGAIAAAIIVLTGHDLAWTALAALPALMLYLINAVASHLFFGVLVTRYRDIAQIIQTAMRVLFFLTPLIWTPEQAGGLRDWLWWNPFTYFIDIFRAPIVDGIIPWSSWLFCLTFSAVFCLIAFSLFAHFRRRIVFWF
ncbi:ABC transporter permease [Hyphobacterium indicum]|uniref:ABC transporter permease n=1 Tax=Hyphobacterium indicum TaxID=2162714 RepID=UPI000D6520EB|nr:ABC transporter permease [Hyphobacterium indicum]